ncbi:hypothetical protein BD289DRAFT_96227 [Coniella lustricola]|uniref:Uncharacterized protein n=1 Tax=Coniella lustricola TaxID=2025994 RepID=A0A2T3AMZ2_9PEZI|nr:hypothetical protein BD289DRAFT_96227 [Coniella lustricola]
MLATHATLPQNVTSAEAWRPTPHRSQYASRSRLSKAGCTFCHYIPRPLRTCISELRPWALHGQFGQVCRYHVLMMLLMPRPRRRPTVRETPTYSASSSAASRNSVWLAKCLTKWLQRQRRGRTRTKELFSRDQQEALRRAQSGSIVEHCKRHLLFGAMDVFIMAGQSCAGSGLYVMSSCKMVRLRSYIRERRMFMLEFRLCCGIGLYDNRLLVNDKSQ